ncbi:N-terminal domain of molybdenum-binding protein [Rubellimicrobium thermophilum DSM 16684]|uniref:N-terminal domain of molybdenum-binding protein n=1 Tax=Rubellimicrobium thermophilum DSM 16684 TaxID=1123069 RepID=S9R1X3_9RHOB|nr:winged helix-turn-helix domain-containing protein [Rubellimicrobium thermophilum]EPX85948.1 N-terminal domain of molybdenum-binding protein [Rubellimicrobium thermophilum DSM 16684]
MTPRISLKIQLDPVTRLGRGKAELLAGIRETGSIAAAGRRMGMSYKRAWQLIAELNSCFAEPVVTTARGGSAHGGAALTPTGEAVLAAYDHMLQATERAIAEDLGRLDALMAVRTVAPARTGD